MKAMTTQQKEAMKHTPGPWRRGQEGNLRIYGPDGQGEHSGLIAEVFPKNGAQTGNAQLIVAATSMLLELERELEELDAWLREEEISDDTKAAMLIREDKIQKVIRLAKGQSTPDKCPTCGSTDKSTRFTSHFAGVPIQDCQDEWHASTPKGSK